MIQMLVVDEPKATDEMVRAAQALQVLLRPSPHTPRMFTHGTFAQKFGYGDSLFAKRIATVHTWRNTKARGL